VIILYKGFFPLKGYRKAEPRLRLSWLKTYSTVWRLNGLSYLNILIIAIESFYKWHNSPGLRGGEMVPLRRRSGWSAQQFPLCGAQCRMRMWGSLEPLWFLLRVLPHVPKQFLLSHNLRVSPPCTAGVSPWANPVPSIIGSTGSHWLGSHNWMPLAPHTSQWTWHWLWPGPSGLLSSAGSFCSHGEAECVWGVSLFWWQGCSPAQWGSCPGRSSCSHMDR